MKESIKKLFNDLQLLFANNPNKEMHLSAKITFLFSLFRDSESSKKMFINTFKNFPDIFPYAISYMENPNCTCKENIRAFIQKEIAVGVEIFLNLLENEEDQKILEILNRACQSIIEKLTDSEFKLYGKVISIKNSPEAYLNIIKKYNEDPRYYYKGIQIFKTQDEKNLDLYFY